MDELIGYDAAWCVRRLPRDLRDMMKREGSKMFVAGGFIRSCIANETVNDIDVFTPTKEDAQRLAWELANGHAIALAAITEPGGVGLLKSRGHRAPYETENAYTVTNRRVTVQFIHRWTFTRPGDAIESFDFTIAKAALWYTGAGVEDPGWRSSCAETFYADLAAKRLVYTAPVRNEDAGGSLLRVLKFYQRGYRIPLDSMGAVIARLMQGVELPFKSARNEAWLARIVTSLLREVDPLVDPDAEGHVDTVDPVNFVDPDGEAV